MTIYPTGPAGDEARMRDELESLRRQKRMRDMQREMDDLRRELGARRVPGTTFIPHAPLDTTYWPARYIGSVWCGHGGVQ